MSDSAADFMLSATTMNFNGPAVVIAAKSHDVNLSHGGRKIAKNGQQSKGSWLRVWLSSFDGNSKATENIRSKLGGADDRTDGRDNITAVGLYRDDSVPEEIR